MARSKASRKYQLTINNPSEHNFKHERIRKILSDFSGLLYWCMGDEIGCEGTYHTHIYVVFKNAVMFDTLHKRFYGAHIEMAQGTNQENREYIQKGGKWAQSAKSETSVEGTFEEFGELPPDREKRVTDTETIFEMVKEGASNTEILEAVPGAMTKLLYIEQTRQTFREAQYRNVFRPLEVIYLWGAAGVGKTRSIMEKYGYSNVFRVTNYTHPFDGYAGEDVLLLDEYRSSFPITEILNYLDGYPLMLPCRYADKVACYTKVYIVSNIPLEQQYSQIQKENPETWQALMRRIAQNIEMTANGRKTHIPILAWTPDPFDNSEKGEKCSRNFQTCLT